MTRAPRLSGCTPRRDALAPLISEDEHARVQ